ncbi:MAG: hypothetical protein ACRC41_07740 [Sarcina sp.]
MIFLITLIVIVIILLVKFKIKITAKINNNNIEIYIYKFKIFPKKNKKFDKKNNIKKSMTTSLNYSRNKQKKKKNLNLLKKFSIKINSFINSLMKNKFKPTLFININGFYSIEDAAINAEAFGLINILLYSLVDFLNLFIKTIPAFKITPLFENKNNLDTNISCIIKINLAQIIFILMLLIKNLTYKGENTNGK